MKKEILVAISVAGVLFGLSVSLAAQEKLSLAQCREMALKYNKDMAAANKQTEAARLMSLSYKANFFPNFTVNGTGIYSTADGSLGVPGGNLPVFLPNPATGELVSSGFAYFPGLNLDYKVGTVYSGGVQVEQPLYMGGKIRAAYKMSLLGKEMAHLNEALTTSEVILNTDKAYVQLVKAKEMKKVAEKYHALLTELSKNVKSAHRHGMKPQNDVLKVQVKLNESELSLRKADNALRLASMNLCHYIGRPLTAQIDISDDFPEVEQEWKVQVSDITARPEYGILNKQIAIAEQEVKLNRSELLPRIGVRGSYDYLHGLEVNDETLMKMGAFSVFLNVSVPLFHFGERTNKVKSAKVKLEQARLEQENVNEKMLLELMQAANNLDEARLETELSERSLEQAFYVTNQARAAFYPSIVLSGSAGWTNSAGSMIVNPGKFLASAVGSLTQPLFNKGQIMAQYRIAKAQQEEASLSFQQALLNAGSEVNDALVACQTSKAKTVLFEKQIQSLEKALESTSLLMEHGTTTYLEVLTARQSLLSAQLSQTANRFTEIQSVINLYQALGGGRE